MEFADFVNPGWRREAVGSRKFPGCRCQIRILYAAPSVPKCEASNGGVPDNASNFGAT